MRVIWRQFVIKSYYHKKNPVWVEDKKKVDLLTLLHIHQGYGYHINLTSLVNAKLKTVKITSGRRQIKRQTYCPTYKCLYLQDCI